MPRERETPEDEAVREARAEVRHQMWNGLYPHDWRFGSFEEAEASRRTDGRLAAFESAVRTGEVNRIAALFDGLTDVTLTQGHPEFGIECTVAIGAEYVTVIQQLSPLAAIENARTQLLAALRAAPTTPET